MDHSERADRALARQASVVLLQGLQKNKAMLSRRSNMNGGSQWGKYMPWSIKPLQRCRTQERGASSYEYAGTRKMRDSSP
mmetsp:Transcript_12751/g.31853  ORF Transcript_12751/g.31853 Transcript_12751/m.31853 type:complete len:80 (-) Transcript_12751:938-1177(-)